MTREVIALITAGGEGTRMAHSHPGTPKALVEVGGRPLIVHTIHRLLAADIGRIHVSLHHRAQQIIHQLRKRSDLPQHVLEFIVEEEPLGTIGALGELRGSDRHVLIQNGDLLSGIDLAGFCASHFERDADLTIATHDEHHRLRLGEVVVQPDGRVTAYLEKPVKQFRISSGTYLVSPAAVDLCEAGVFTPFPTFVTRVITQGCRVFGFHHDASWIDVNDGRDLEEARRMFADDPVAFGVHPRQLKHEVETKSDCGGLLGLDIGGSKLLAAVLSPDRSRILGWRKVPTPTRGGPEAVFECAVALGRELTAELGQVRAVGIGFAGLVDHESGIVDSSVILPGWDGFPLGVRGAAAFGLPCTVDNDATAAGWGEYVALGAPPSLNMVLLTVGTGIGGAVVIDGKLYRGCLNTSGEFGNTTIDWRGHDCPSGNRGSLNTLASGKALVRRAVELARSSSTTTLGRNGRPITGELVGEAAAAGDPVAQTAVSEAARALGAGVANLINIFNPDHVVLAGGLCGLGPAYLETVVAEASARAFPIAAQHARIAFSVHGELACAHGAACLAEEALQ